MGLARNRRAEWSRRVPVNCWAQRGNAEGRSRAPGANNARASRAKTPRPPLTPDRPSIIYGHFLTHSVRMALSGVNPAQRVWIDKTEEKGSEVNLATHLFTTREPATRLDSPLSLVLLCGPRYGS